MTRALCEYLDGLITGIAVGVAVFGFATGRWWLSLLMLGGICYYNAKVWGRR